MFNFARHIVSTIKDVSRFRNENKTKFWTWCEAWCIERLCNPNYWEARIFARSIETGGSFDQVTPGASEIPIMLSSASSVLTYSCYYGFRIELALGIWNFCISFSYTLALFLSRKRGFYQFQPLGLR